MSQKTENNSESQQKESMGLLSHIPKTGVIVVVGILILTVLLFIYEKSNNIGDDITPSEEVNQKLEDLGPFAEEVKQFEKQQDQMKTDLALYNEVAGGGDVKKCDAIVGEERKSKCVNAALYYDATANNKLDLCSQISTPLESSRCSNIVHYQLAKKSNTLEDCESIKGDNRLLENCKSEIVFSQIDAPQSAATKSICESLTGDSKMQCESVIDVNMGISNDESNLQKAYATLDTSFCNKIDVSALKTSCLDTIMFKKAISQKSKSGCNRIITDTTKENCLNYFSGEDDKSIMQKALKNLDATMCNAIKSNSSQVTCNDTINFKLALQDKSKSKCSSIYNPSTKSECERVLDSF